MQYYAIMVIKFRKKGKFEVADYSKLNVENKPRWKRWLLTWLLNDKEFEEVWSWNEVVTKVNEIKNNEK